MVSMLYLPALVRQVLCSLPDNAYRRRHHVMFMSMSVSVSAITTKLQVTVLALLALWFRQLREKEINPSDGKRHAAFITTNSSCDSKHLSILVCAVDAYDISACHRSVCFVLC